MIRSQRNGGGAATNSGFPPLTKPRQAAEQLQQCARLLREHLRHLSKATDERSPAAAWLVEHYSILQFQIRETRRRLHRSYLRGLPKIEAGASARDFRVYRMEANFAAATHRAFHSSSIPPIDS